MSPDHPTYVFDPFELDPVKRLLLREGKPLPLTARAFDILLLLIEERHRIVPKEELLSRVWAGVVVEESNLFRQVSRVRRALGERPDEHRYVVTIPNEGYRFVGRIEPPKEATPEAPEAEARLAPVPAGHEIGIDRVENVPGEPVGTSWMRTWLPAAGAAAVLIFASLAALGGKPVTADTPVLQQVTFDEGFPREATWSPDGQSIAYTSDQGGNPDIWIRALADHDGRRMTTGAAAETSPAWSPDGRLIAYRSTRDGGGVFVAAIDGTNERQLSAFGDHPQWSPDGSRVLFTWRSGEGVGPLAVYTVGSSGGAPRLVRPDLLTGLGVVAAAWHPSGRVSILAEHEGQPTMLIAPLDDGAAVRLFETPSFRERLAVLDLRLGRHVWSPAGDQLFLEGTNGVENLWKVTIDPITYDVTGGPERLTVSAGIDRHVSIAPDGRRLLFDIRSSRTQLWSFPFDAARGVVTSAGSRVTSGVPNELDAVASNDGQKFVYRATRGDLRELWEHSLTSGEDRLLFKDAGGNFSRPRWSPDGRQLVFLRQPAVEAGAGGNGEIVLLTSLDNRVRTYPIEHQVVFRPTDWSTDGRTILGTCQPRSAQPSVICLTRTPEESTSISEVRVIASDAARELRNSRLSPDQRWILFQALDRRPQGSSTLFVMPATGGPWTAITDGGSFADKPHWSADGETIYFVSDRGGWMNVWAQPFDLATGKTSGPPSRVTSFNSEREMISPNLRDMDIAITRHQLLLPIAESTGQLWMLSNVTR